MKTETISINEYAERGDILPPFPLEVIPNNMGINLCSVDSISTVRKDDGQLISLTINFIPA